MLKLTIPRQSAWWSLCWSALICTHLFAFSASAQVEDPFSVSGFVRLVGGYLFEDQAEFQGYEDSIDFRPNSVVGLKTEYRFNQRWSAVAQGVVTRSDFRKSGFDWLYLGYRPNNHWDFKFGRFRTPLFEFSEVVDVGFAYPWVIPPQPTYSSALFSTTEGVEATYHFNIEDILVSLSAHTGGFNGELIDADGDGSARSETDLLTGVNLRIQAGSVQARLGYVVGEFDFEIPGVSEVQQIANQLGFARSAEFLELDGDVEFFQASIGYDNFSYFVRAEATLIDTEVRIGPRFSSGYISAGLYRGAFTYYALVNLYDTDNEPFTQEIPFGLAPQLDALAAGVQDIADSRLRDDLKAYTLGARWDLRPNLAVKSEFTLLRGQAGQRSSFNIRDDEAFDRQSSLWLVSLDWIF